VVILGSDLSTRVLKLAAAGEYPPERLRQTPGGIVSKYFHCHRHGQEKTYRVTQDIRSMVHFARLNLMDAWPMRGPFDVIFCRNVMIYFDKPTQTRLGGLLHVMLPASNINPAKAQTNPYMFVDTGVPAFFRQLYAAGAVKGRLKVKVAGGASTQQAAEDRFAIGKRNHVTLRKMFWQNGILVDGEDVGGTCPAYPCRDLRHGIERLLYSRKRY